MDILCTQNLWRELHFEMLTIKNAGFHSGEAYYPPSDVVSRGQTLFSPCKNKRSGHARLLPMLDHVFERFETS